MPDAALQRRNGRLNASGMSGAFRRGACAAALALMCGLAPSRVFGYSELRVYRPSGTPPATNEYAFATPVESTYSLIPWTSMSTGVVNQSNGGLVVFASAWVGGADSRASQVIRFNTPSACHVYATIKMTYTGGTATYGFASWAGTAWRWHVNNEPWREYHLDAPFTVLTIGEKVIDLALLAAGGFTYPAAVKVIVDLIDHTWNVAMLGANMAALASAGEAMSIERTVHFTVPEGSHALSVGLKGTASALLTGFGCSFLLGQVEEVRLGINTYPDLLPDVIMDGVSLENENELRSHHAVDITVHRSNIGNAVADLETYELVAVPVAGGPSEMVRRRGSSGARGYTIIDAYHGKEETFSHTFTNKGWYTLLGEVDPDNLMPEILEINNLYSKSVHVRGSPPYTPLEPNSGYALELHRNQTFTFYTSGTDRDDDALYYGFEYRPNSTSAWQVLLNDLNVDSNGWSVSSSLDVTPVLDDPALLPTAGAGLDSRTFVTFATNYYRIRARSADVDGISVSSPDKAFTVTLNAPFSAPVVSGVFTGDTLQAVSLTASSSDPEGDPVAFRFDWRETATPQWTDWYWPEPGQSNLTVSHLYTNSGTYCIAVQATDLYAMKRTSPLVTSPTATHCVDIGAYVPATNALTVASGDEERSAALPDAGFIIRGGATNLTNTTGAAGVWQTAAAPGVYTVEFANVAGYLTPAWQTGTLPHGGAIEFTGDYRHETGAIQVYCNVAGQGIITGLGTATGSNYTFAGSAWSVPSAWAGGYEIAYEPVDEAVFCPPVPPRETNTLAATGSIAFYGRYIKRPIAQLSFAYPTNSYQPPNAFVLVDEESAVFDASASYSPSQPQGDGGLFPPLSLSIARYAFDYDDGTVYAEDAVESRDGVFDGITAHVFRRTGVRHVTVTVEDSLGCISGSEVGLDVWVKERPVADVSIEPSPAIAGERVRFSGSGMDGDPGDTIIGYEWSHEDTGILSTNRTFSLSNLSVGAHRISLRVQGSDLVWSAPATERLVIHRPKDWPLFKHDERRHAQQLSYAGRTHGKLPYGPAGGNWPFAAGSAIQGSPAVGDLDGAWTNGLEVAFISSSGTLYVVDSSGLELWSTNIGVSSSTPAIGDIDGDSLPDIVVGTESGVYAFARGGSNLYHHGSAHSFVFSAPVIAEVDLGTAGREVAVTADDGSVHLVSATGAPVAGLWPVATGGGAPVDPLFISSPAVANVDTNSPGLEVVVGGLDGNLYVLDSGGTSLAPPFIPPGGPIQTTPAVADLCPQADGLEIVVGADDGFMSCYNYSNGQFSTMWQHMVTPSQKIRSSPAIGVMGEGQQLQVAFGCDNGVVTLLRGTNGTVLGSFDCGAGVQVRSTPAVANIDTAHNVSMGDYPEVVFCGDDGWLYAVSFIGGGAVWSNDLSTSPIYSSPAVADIDHDPELEILVGADDGKLYVLKATPDPALAPAVSFTASVTRGGRPLTVVFTDTSTNNPTSWWWDFGDGAGSAEQNPVYVYDTPGTNTVIFTACNDHGCRSVTNVAYITVDPVPSAAFAVTPAVGLAPLTVQFTDQSLYGPDAWSWEFGDGNQGGTRHPQHIYTNPGVYDVSLTASNAFGPDTAVQSNAVTVEAVRPVADFLEDVTYGCEPLAVAFTDLSAHTPTSWAWEFGDGATSDEQHPAHLYDAAGLYLVSLTASNAAGSDTKANALYITVMTGSETVSDPVMDLSLDENAGTIAHDATVHANDGTILGASWMPGVFGSALYFHGGGVWGDDITVPHAPSLNINGPFAVEAWIRAAGTDTYLAIVDKYRYEGGLSYGFSLYLSSGRLRLSVYGGAQGDGNVIGTTDLRDDDWHHVRGAWDGTQLTVEVDGEAEKIVPWAHPPAPTTQACGIGKRLSGWGGFMPFLGRIDEVMISTLQPGESPRLSVTRAAGGQVLVSWSGCGTLQTASDVDGPWTDVLHTSHPHGETPVAASTFYRVRVP